MRMKPTSNRRPSNEMARVLNRSKQSLPKTTTGYGLAPDSVVSLIATGKITRERSCDGKKRFRTYEFAERIIRPALETKYGKHFEVYACAFCNGWHLATSEEFAA